MGMYYILANNGDIYIPGGRSFIGQLITFLLGQDLIAFSAIGLGLILIYDLVSSIIKYKEE